VQTTELENVLVEQVFAGQVLVEREVVDFLQAQQFRQVDVRL
jgi:hypothetical protein